MHKSVHAFYAWISVQLVDAFENVYRILTIGIREIDRVIFDVSVAVPRLRLLYSATGRKRIDTGEPSDFTKHNTALPHNRVRSRRRADKW